MQENSIDSDLRLFKSDFRILLLFRIIVVINHHKKKEKKNLSAILFVLTMLYCVLLNIITVAAAGILDAAGVCFRDIWFMRKIGQFSSKWDKSVTFKGQFSVHFDSSSQMYWK